MAHSTCLACSFPAVVHCARRRHRHYRGVEPRRHQRRDCRQPHAPRRPGAGRGGDTKGVWGRRVGAGGWVLGGCRWVRLACCALRFRGLHGTRQRQPLHPHGPTRALSTPHPPTALQFLAEAAEAMAQAGFTPQQMVRVMGGEAADLAPLEPGESQGGAGGAGGSRHGPGMCTWVPAPAAVSCSSTCCLIARNEACG